MVMTPALIVPDQASWTMWGRDLGGLGLTPAAAPEQARQLVVPDPVPAALTEAVNAAWQRMPAPRRYVAWPRPLAGTPAAELLADDAPARRDNQSAPGHEDAPGGHGADAGHDHHDMMAIVGDPSADGLVMESIDFALGPLAAGLPGGLVLDLSLDGDVVERCEARATLMPEPIGGGACGDPTASATWTVAVALAHERAAAARPDEATARIRVAAVETERALSHVSWLRAFGLVLGWSELGERAERAVKALMPLRTRLELTVVAPGNADGLEGLAAGLEASRRPVERALALLEGSRRLRSRTRGRAKIPRDRIAGTKVAGTVARAAGIPCDARAGDPLYEALGFRETTLAGGDAEARTLLRTAEAASALNLAIAALGEGGSREPMPADLSAETAVEGPRGPVRARFENGRLEASAPGAAALLDLAGEAVSGLELGSALAALASFDLSGWRVPE